MKRNSRLVDVYVALAPILLPVVLFAFWWITRPGPLEKAARRAEKSLHNLQRESEKARRHAREAVGESALEREEAKQRAKTAKSA